MTDTLKTADSAQLIQNAIELLACGADEPDLKPTAVKLLESALSAMRADVGSSAGPVRTIIRKEIVKGKYGIVCVAPVSAKSDTVYVSVADMAVMSPASAAELRAAAIIFMELAQALDPREPDAPPSPSEMHARVTGAWKGSFEATP